MRTTLHLVTVDDALGLAPVMDDVHRRVFRSTPFAKALVGLETEPLIARARQALEARPMRPVELGRLLATDHPGRDPAALAALARYHLPLVQVPPRGLWGHTAAATNTTLEAWSARVPVARPIEDVVRRYLAAFGPASVADIRTWSWLTGLRDVVTAMRPTLRTYRDPSGRELLDIEDGRFADEDVSAPIRFLPQYDNVFLSHDDRSRINGALTWGLDFGWKGAVLVDGVITGAWRVRRAAGVARMTVELGRALAPDEEADLRREAEALATFLDPDLERELSLVPPPDR